MTARCPDGTGTVATIGSMDENEIVAGYRVIRTLGVGRRATVYLGHGDFAVSDGTAAHESPVALKVFSDATDEADIARELDALEAVCSLHVVTLLDVSASAGGTACFVLERLQPVTLATLLRARRWIRSGEAVTIVASVYRGIRDMHSAGFAHNASSINSVLFDASGRPVLTGLARTSELRPDSDWKSFESITTAVLDRVEPDGRADALAAVAGSLHELVTAPTEQSCERFEDGIFRLAQPAPVVLRSPDDDARSDAAQHAHTRRTISPAAHADPARRTAVNRTGTDRDGTDSTGTGARILRFMDTGPITSLTRLLKRLIAARRRQVIVGAAVAATAAVVGLAAIPPGAGAQHPSAQLPSGQHSLAGSSDASAPRASQHGTAHPTRHAEPAVAPADDPVAATTLLLAARSRCLHASSVDCLSQVDQDASAILTDDTALVRSQEHAFTDYSTYSVSLIQRTGDAALVELTPPSGADTKPASAVVINDEAGWRLRELFQN